ncbi:MAG: RagB/SusD family nutrient uptake outer membrane protein [Mangrovibacterium sp.]
MKKNIIAFILAFIVFTSCNENKFLEEDPLSIYTADISLETSSDYQAAVNYLYNRTRYVIFQMDPDSRFAFWYATDLAFCSADVNKLNTYKATMIPTFSVVSNMWRYTYVIVNQANLILTRIENADLTETEKNAFRGEALFFRAFAYRILANLYGGVPLILEEITAPRRDFVRAARDEVYTQCKSDLTEAVSLLANIDEVEDGKISKQMAQHLLSEIYISLGDNDQAITTASAVISYPAMALMTSRFGSKADEVGSPFSDLFKVNNQNRSSGNTESLWVIQYDYLNVASATNDQRCWTHLPFYQNITITVDDVKTTAFKGVTAEKGGRGVAWMQPTAHVCDEIWEEGDLRNASYLIVRDVKIDNEASPAYGKWFVADGYSVQANRVRNWFPFFMKVASGYVPEDYYQKDSNGEPLLTGLGEHLVTNSGNSSFRDLYLFRLAETYLLRAEAYINKGNQKDAAADINTVRARSQAQLVDESDVDIDYILDERLRELTFEELRMCTLCRMGKLVERTQKYNSTYLANDGSAAEASGKSMQDYHNLWPIPYSEIERNIYGNIEQNPGYVN